MRIHFNIRFVRPSEVVAAIENGVVGAGQLVGKVARAVPLEVRERVRRAKFELAAAKLAAQDIRFETMSYQERDQLMRDEAEIAMRALEIRQARRAKDVA